jgi:CubicO group peptidase (beta-lactamase class C family)
MQRSVVVLLIALLQVRGLPPTNDQLFVSFGDALESLRIQAGIPGMATVIVGETDRVWDRAFGQLDVERTIGTRTDTPFHVDGLTQVFTASLILRCVEEGRLSLDDRVGQYASGLAEPDATIRQVLTHTTGDAFSYRPDRFDPLRFAIRYCTGDSYRESLANWLERLGMSDSVPGADANRLVPPAEGIPGPAAAERYTRVLTRLAKPYSVDSRGRPTASQPATTTLTPATGLITTVLDFAKFDLALRSGVVVRRDTLLAAWRPATRGSQSLPHGLGWFVQTYNGETIAWQFGVGDNASSSLVVTVPARGFSLILAANSDGLAKGFNLSAGDLTASPFGRLFLGTFVK